MTTRRQPASITPLEALKAELPKLSLIYPGDRKDVIEIISDIEEGRRAWDLDIKHKSLRGVADIGEETSKRREQYRALASLFYYACHPGEAPR